MSSLQDSTFWAKLHACWAHLAGFIHEAVSKTIEDVLDLLV
jgi:hypothetical protein